MKGNDGYFYGTTYGGPGAFSNTFGTAFKIGPSGELTTLHNFIGGTGITNGTNPKAGLVLANDGNFYGTTFHGGPNTSNLEGTIFRITAEGLFTRVYSFTNAYVTNDGGYPTAGLVQGSDGNLYGAASGGGTWGGTVYRVTSDGVFTILQRIPESAYTRLFQASDGNFYGTTYGNSYTTFTSRIFKVSTNGLFSTLHYFYNNDGGGLSELTQGSDGSFYCTSQNGGAGYGAVLQITIGPVFKATTLANGTLTLTWSTDAGSKYQLQYKSDLNSGNWINLGNSVLATGSTLSATDSVANDPQRFYRVAVLPQ